MSGSALDLKWIPRWNARPLPFLASGILVILAGGLLWWRFSIGAGLGLASLGLAWGLGGWALVSQWRSERFDFLEASHDLYALRQPLSDDEEARRRIEWITWGSTKICERADLASGSARPSERRKFLRDLSHLIDFADPIIVAQDRRGFRRFDHLLKACEELSDWPEAKGPAGTRVIEALSVHLGNPDPGEGFPDYVAARRDVMKEIHQAGRENEEFDEDLFRSLLDGELEQMPEPREDGRKVLTAENWDQPDTIHKAFFGTSDTRHLRSEHADVVQELLGSDLIEEVPDPVRDIYQTARGAIVYGYFYYPLYALASEQLHRVLDAAFGHKCDELEGPSGLNTFHRRIEWLTAQGILHEEDRRLWDAAKRLRNIGSHPEDQTLIPPGQALRSLEITAQAINQLFDPGQDTVSFPSQRNPDGLLPELAGSNDRTRQD